MGSILSSAPYPVITVAVTGYSRDNELLYISDKNTTKRLKQFLYCPITVIGDILEEGLTTSLTG